MFKRKRSIQTTSSPRAQRMCGPIADTNIKFAIEAESQRIDPIETSLDNSVLYVLKMLREMYLDNLHI